MCSVEWPLIAVPGGCRGEASVCLRKTRRTETMMDVSRVSRKTRRKMGTEKSCISNSVWY